MGGSQPITTEADCWGFQNTSNVNAWGNLWSVHWDFQPGGCIFVEHSIHFNRDSSFQGGTEQAQLICKMDDGETRTVYPSPVPCDKDEAADAEFTLGEVGSTTCPPNSRKITTEAECWRGQNTTMVPSWCNLWSVKWDFQ